MGFFAQQGWECPKCGRILAPSMMWCPWCCSGQETTATTTTNFTMRSPTEEERKSVSDYIDSISTPTGVNAFDLMDELKTIKCPKCGRTDYIKDLKKDFHIKDPGYKYKCINCNTYIEEEEK